jgi:threonine dehydrogenase-like Zn-dependent dehydrogenase
MAVIWASRLGVRDIIVTGTDLDVPVRFGLAQELGATRVVNVQREDLAPVIADLGRGAARHAGAGVDVWVECSGSQRAIAQGIELVKKTGRVVLIGLVGPETIPVPWNRLLFKELDLVGCFSSPPSSWEKALAVEVEEADKLRKLATHILPLEEWERGFAMMATGEAVKILIDMQREEA